MKPYMQEALDLFHAVPGDVYPEAAITGEINEENVAHGLFLTEEALAHCSDADVRFIRKKFGCDVADYNNGLFKSFGRVLDMTPIEFYTHQVLHYLSVYLQNGDMTDD